MGWPHIVDQQSLIGCCRIAELIRESLPSCESAEFRRYFTARDRLRRVTSKSLRGWRRPFGGDQKRWRATIPPPTIPQVTPQVTPQVRRLLAACPVPKSMAELQGELGLSDRKHFQKAYLNPSLASGLIERTSPDKPRSRFQRYRLTAMGKRVLEESAE